MTDRRRAFFTELAELMERYQVTMEVREDCGSYGGCLADGIDFDFDWIRNEEGDTVDAGETVVWTGRYFDAGVMRRLVDESD